jgi:protein-S-isoprenylcysteine O-methyltransferase Ste14
MDRGRIGWLLVIAQFALLIILVLLPWRTTSAPAVIAGLVLIAAGGVLGLAAGLHLGRALTPTPVPVVGAGLRTDGVYRFVRHPIYSGVLIGVLGFLVAVGSVSSWICGGVILVFFLLKSRWEDRLLHEQYGDDWRQWAAATGKLVPRPARRKGST